MSLDAMKQALEALELLARYENPETKIQVRKPRDGGPIVTMYPHKVASEAAAALRAAIEQAQEPVALETVYDTIIQWDENDGKRSRRELARRIVALYTAPSQWQGLTDEDVNTIWRDIDGSEGLLMRFARAIEAKLKEKNRD